MEKSVEVFVEEPVDQQDDPPIIIDLTDAPAPVNLPTYWLSDEFGAAELERQRQKMINPEEDEIDFEIEEDVVILEEYEEEEEVEADEGNASENE